MRIKNLTATGVKVPSFTHDLKPITIFHGDNTAGKTARLDAVRLLLAGHHPDLGKTAGATFGLSCGPNMTIAAHTESGAVFSRGWAKVGKSVKTDCQPDPFPETPAVLLDARTYLDKSAPERVKYVAGLVNLEESEWTGERVCKEIRGLQLKTPSQAHVEALIGVADDLDASDEARHDAGESVQDWVERLIREMKEKTSAEKASIDRLKRFQQGQIQLQAGDDQGVTRNVDAELAAANEQLGRLRAELEAEENLVKDAARRKEEIYALQERIGELEEAANDPEDGLVRKSAEKNIEDIEAYIAKLEESFSQEELAEAVMKSAKLQGEIDRAEERVTQAETARAARAKIEAELADLKDVSAETEAQTKAVADLTAKIASHKSQVETIREAMKEPQREETEADASREALVERAEQLSGELERDQQTKCPCCERVGVECRSISARIKSGKKQQEQLGEMLAEVRKRRLDASERRMKIEKDLFAALTADEANRAMQIELSDVKDRVATLQRRQDRRTALTEQLRAIEAPETLTRREIEDLKASLSRVTEGIARFELIAKQVRTARQELDRVRKIQAQTTDLRMKLAALPPITINLDRLPALVPKIQAQQKVVGDLEFMQKSHAAAQREEARRQAALADLEAAEARWEVLKAVTKELQVIQAALVKEIFGELLTTVNGLCGAVLKRPIVYHEGDLGRFEDGTWISHECFSGTEKLLCYAGISAALSQKAPVRVLLLDELGRLTEPNRFSLMEALLRMIEGGVIDQVLACDVTDAPYKTLPPGRVELVQVTRSQE